MNKYPAYKESGIEWIGDIPEHWEVKRLKYIKSDEKNSFVDGPFGSNLKTDHFIENGDVYVIDSGYITSGTFEFKRDFKTISKEHFVTVQRSECNEDDIIISKIGANFGMSGILPRLDKPSLISGNTLKLTINKNKYFLKLIHLQLLNLKQHGEIDLLVKGSAQPALSMGAMYNLPFVVPTDIKEQTAIANYLVLKTEQIETLICNKQKLIELLKEERIATINQAVTKGLDLNVPMKHSGVEWLGEIPEHWEVWKLSHAFNNIGSGTTPESGNPLYYENGTVNWLNTGDLNDSYLSQTSKKVTLKAIEDYSALKLFPSGSLVIAMYGATIGKVSIVNSKITVNQACCVFYSSKIIENEFLFYWFLSNKENIINLAKGGGQPNISQDILKKVKVPCPSILEQKEIIDFIKVAKEKIEIIITKAEQEIELLKEYKTALISEVVTGKVDVREEILEESCSSF